MRYYILLGIILAATTYANACSCSAPTTFCESIAITDSSHTSSIVIRAVVIRISGDDIVVEVLDLLAGELNEHALTIRGGDGANCLVSPSRFQKDAEYIMAPSQMADNRYALYACHVCFLPIKDGLVVGRIAPGIDKLAWQELGTTMGCEGLGSLLASIQVFPNPARDEVKISTTYYSDAEVKFTLFDMVGRLIITEQAVFDNQNILQIVTSGFSAGTYVLRADLNGTTRHFKLIILGY